MKVEQEATNQLVRQVLGDQYMDLRVDRFHLEENVETGHCRIRCALHKHPTGVKVELDGEGVGFVDAVFNALKASLAETFPSLKSIQFSAFRVEANLATRRDKAGSDAVGRVILELQNSRGTHFHFEHASRSITSSAVIVTLQGVEYFVNTERAFISLNRALTDARKRNRPDLIEKYHIQIARLVENTSYSEVIERMRQEESEKQG